MRAEFLMPDVVHVYTSKFRQSFGIRVVRLNIRPDLESDTRALRDSLSPVV
jgi:hypothetical protein